MDEFYIVKQYFDGVNNGVLYCASRDFAESNIHDSPYLDPRVSFSLHRMVRIDQITDELYVEVDDSDVAECEICGLIVKFKGQRTNFSSEPMYHGGGEKYCRQCYERMVEIDWSSMPMTMALS